MQQGNTETFNNPLLPYSPKALTHPTSAQFHNLPPTPNHSTYRHFYWDNHVMTFASDKRFGLINLIRRETRGTQNSRLKGALRAVILTFHKTSFNGLRRQKKNKAPTTELCEFLHALGFCGDDNQ